MGYSRNAEEFEHRCVLYWLCRLLLSVAVQPPECKEVQPNRHWRSHRSAIINSAPRSVLSRIAHDAPRWGCGLLEG